MTIEEYSAAAMPLIKLALRDDADKQVHHLISRIFYGFEAFRMPTWILASQAALAAYAGLNQGTPLTQKRWAEQPAFDLGREVFHFEHICSGKMFERFARQNNHELTPDLICNWVRNNYRIAWILKRENKLLPRSDRGQGLSDALAIYAKAGIIIVG